MYHLQALKQLSALGADRWSQTSLHPMRIPFDACSNYKAVIWGHFLSTVPVVPSSKDHGWGKNVDELLVTQWMCGPTAPHTALQLLFCMCKRSRKLPDCICLNSYMSCTNLCRIANKFKPVKLGRVCSSAHRQDWDETLDGTLPRVMLIYICHNTLPYT